MDDTSSLLRSLLSLSTSHTEELLCSVRGTRQSGSGYRLAGYPLIWIDADAFLWYMYHAALYEHMQDDPLPFLEAAYSLGARGSFLIEEPYSTWAKERREEVDGAFRLCVHQLGRLYLERNCLMEAELSVRSYWATHMMDEDALRLLMDILGEQQRYQEAHACYQQTCRLREEEGQEMDPRTHHLAEYWRTKPLSGRTKSVASSQLSAVSSSQSPSLLAYENVIQFLQVIQALLPMTVSNGQVSSVPSERDTSLVIVLPTPDSSSEIASFDLDTWLSDRANKLRALGTSGPPITDQQRQVDVSTEIESWNRMVDQDHPPTKEFLSTRRSVLAGLILVSDAILTWVRSGRVTPFIAKEFLAQCATSIVACEALLKGDGLAAVEYTLRQYLPYLIVLAKAPSPFQKDAAYLAIQACCLMGIVKSHRLQYGEDVEYCNQAVEFAKVTGDSQLVAAVLTNLGDAWFFVEKPQKYLKAYQEAERLIPKDPPFFPARLQICIYMGLSDAYAVLGHSQEAKNYLDLANAISLPLDDDLFIPALSYDLLGKSVIEASVARKLGDLKDQNGFSADARSLYKRADTALGQQLPEFGGGIEHVRVQAKIKRALIAVKLGNMEQFMEYFKEGVQGANDLGSEKRIQEAKEVWRAAMERWPHERQVIELYTLLI